MRNINKNNPIKISDLIYELPFFTSDKNDIIPSGFDTLDKYISGFHKSDLILIGSRPAMGKSTFARSLAQNIAIGTGKKCLLFSLELSNKQQAEKLLFSQAGVELKKMKEGAWTANDAVRIGNAIEQLNDTELYIDDTPFITVSDIKSKSVIISNVDCIIIDYLSLISPEVRRNTRLQENSEIMQDLKRMAKELNIPVICCTLLSKSGRPRLSDLRELGSLEQNTDVIMFLHRESYYGDYVDEEQKNIDVDITELIIAKNRHGEIGTVNLLFDKISCKFAQNIEELF